MWVILMEAVPVPVPARCGCADGRPHLDYRWVQHGPGHSHPQTRLLWSACGAQHQELADSNAAGCYSLRATAPYAVSTLSLSCCLVQCKAVSQVPNDDPCMYVAVSNPGADTSKSVLSCSLCFSDCSAGERSFVDWLFLKLYKHSVCVGAPWYMYNIVFLLLI
jgi:hypothetical protein